MRRRLIFIGVVGVVLVALLALDLANRGLAWQFFWSQTGEEEPLAQVRGMVEWAGNLTRPQPHLQPMTTFANSGNNPYGINTFLEQEVEPEKRARSLQMIADAGFGWIRQQFPWEDIEIHGRGDFEDRRNDVDGDGEIDTISAWAKYDMIVDLAAQHNIEIFARLDNPPSWTHADPAIGAFAPPDDLQDFVNYATAVAERYQGRIRYYQVWNEPNIYPEWGEQAVNPEAYTEMLCRTYAALKAVDPEIIVVSGALAPTLALTGRDLNDFIFLQRMYDAGAADCFDILSVQGYGLNSGPTDRRMRPTTVNFARNLYIRDIMIANDDADKPIWISEAAWNAQPEDPAQITSLYGAYGIVTEEQAARYMPLAYERMQREWPWVDVMFYWFFKRPHDFEANQSWYHFRMVEPDFTPLPVYDSMRDYITGQEPVLYPGVHQAEDWGITLVEPQLVDAPGADFGQAVQARGLSFNVYGNMLLLRWRGDVVLEVEIDGQNTLAGANCTRLMGADDWHLTVLCESLLPDYHTVSIQPFPDDPFLIDAIIVLDRTFENVYPLAASALGVLGVLAWVIISAIRARRHG